MANILPKMRVVVLGGGTAGWMAAIGIARLLPDHASVQLIESQDIGIVGVGEATLPHLRGFVERVGIDEAAFMRATHATFKLGIEFRDFGAIGERYIHPFGAFGEPVGGVGFHHYWLEMRRRDRAGPIGAYSLPIAMAAADRFAPPATDGALASTYGYAYQFDATLFGPFVRTAALAAGVVRHEGVVVGVERNEDSGDVAGLILADGRTIAGDLFIDCSGFRSVLLGGELAEPWEDWSHWLRCDRAAVVPSAATGGPIHPYTTATAMRAGWRWTIPLQHRTGNGYVFASAFESDDEACATIAGAAAGTPIADPRVLRFRPGRRRASWRRNVVAIGLASGFLEPLESTSIHLAQMAITNLIELFPTDGRIDARDRDRFNHLVDLEYDRVRDFLILHYHATRRDDSAFWNAMRTMTVPDTLLGKLDLWRETGRVEKYSVGLFHEPSWIAVLIGQGLLPDRHDPRVALAGPDAIARALAGLEHAIDAEVAAMPDHRAYLLAEAARVASPC